MKTTTGFIVFVSDETSENELENLQTALFRIKGVTAINPIRKPFEIYGLQSKCTSAVASKLIAALEGIE